MSRRGGHVVDLALLYAGLERATGVSQAELGRRYRKSPGYMSVLCRFGHALQRVPPEQLDVLRVAQLTFRAVQGIVTRHGDPDALLRAASAVATGPAPRPRSRVRLGAPSDWNTAPYGPDPIDPLPETSEAISRRAEFVYTWDAGLARRDPAGALAAYEQFVRAMTGEVVARLRRAAGDLGPSPAAVTQGGRDLLPPVPPSRAFDDLSLRQLDERVGQTLRAHRHRMDDFLSERARSLERRTAAGPGGSLAPMAVDAAEVEADLG